MLYKLDAGKKLRDEYFRVAERYPGSIVLCNNGEFYEAYGDDIGRKVAKIVGFAYSESGSMTGVPFKAKWDCIRKLVDAGYTVVVIKQVSRIGSKIFREVEMIVDRFNFMDYERDTKVEHNIVSVYYSGDLGCGLSVCDLVTGNFRAFDIVNTQELLDELYRLDVKGIKMNENFQFSKVFEDVRSRYEEIIYVEKEEKYSLEMSQEFIKQNIPDFGLFRDATLIASGFMLMYIKEHNIVDLAAISSVVKEKSNVLLVLDEIAIRNLELVRNISKGTVDNTLLSVLDSTKTVQGTRLLREWVEKPSRDIKEIKGRLNIVESIIHRDGIIGEIRELLESVTDIGKLLRRMTHKSLTCNDLKVLKVTFNTIKEISSHLGDDYKIYEGLMSSVEVLGLLKKVNSVIGDGHRSIKRGYSDLLDGAYDFEEDIEPTIERVELELASVLGTKTITVSYSKKRLAFTFKKPVKCAQSVPDYFIKLDDKEYTTSELQDLGKKHMESEALITEFEEKVVTELSEYMTDMLRVIQDINYKTAYTDVLFNFAFVALKNNYVKPEVHTGYEISIKGGRHPVIESKIKSFVSNDIDFEREKKLHFITGPNMSGKSTYMRQTALICIMAHMGCFVPAGYAKISILDRIFTRIGASDDLVNGKSTFMVEMSELANISLNATESSLLVLDEIGRGTGVVEGKALAEAVVEDLVKNVGAKSIFSTHYSELCTLKNRYPYINNCCIKVNELSKNDIEFSPRVIQGGVEKSYGLRVAKLAGVKERVLFRADELIKDYNDKSDNLSDYLRGLDVDAMAPLEALTILSSLVKGLSSKS